MSPAKPPRAVDRSWPLVLALSAIVGPASSCHIVGAAGEPCRTADDCASGDICGPDHTCAFGKNPIGHVAAEGEGAEGEGAEGEGAEGEGAEGEGGEGEGGEGEGAEGEGGEGEGEGAEGEGEGEGGEGEGEGGEGEGGEGEGGEGEGGEGEGGEGEGEGAPAVCGDGQVDATEECDDANTADGDGCSSSCTSEVPPERGDPNQLTLFVSPTSTCQKLLGTVVFTPTAAGVTSGGCTVQLANLTGLPIDITSVALPVAPFGVTSSPQAPFTIDGDGSFVTFVITATAPATSAGDAIVVGGARLHSIALRQDGLTAAPNVVMVADNGCNAFGPVDRLGERDCVVGIRNTSASSISVSDESLADIGIGFGAGQSVAFTLGPKETVGFTIAAGGGVAAGTAANTQLVVTSAANDPQLTLSATFGDPVLHIVPTHDCVPGPQLATCTSFGAVPSGQTGSRALTMHNAGTIDVIVNGGSTNGQTRTLIQADEPFPFIVGPGETADLHILATSNTAGTGAWSDQLRLDDGAGRVYAAIALSGVVP